VEFIIGAPRLASVSETFRLSNEAVFARHPARWRFWGFALGFPSGGMGMAMGMMAPLVLTLKPRNGDGTCSCNYATSNCEGEMANERW